MIPNDLWFSAGSLNLSSGILRASLFCSLEESPMPTLTDTILTIRGPHCTAGIEFSSMIAHKYGRFVCQQNS
jgi:hypothetical protein